MAAQEEHPLQRELNSQNKHPASGKYLKIQGTDHREEFYSTEERKSITLTNEMLQGAGAQTDSSQAQPGSSKPSTSQGQSQTLQQQGLKASQAAAAAAADPFYGAVASSHRSSVDSGTGSDPSRTPGHFVIVAIDFGTTFSGYAFCFTRDPDHIHMMRKWEGGDPGVINQKTPTCLLMTPDGSFHSFGFTARDFYHDLDPIEAQKWYYFDKFKMVLHYNAVSTFNYFIIFQYYCKTWYYKL